MIPGHSSLISTTTVPYEFHIHFTSFHCTGRYELNKLTLLPMCGFTAQLLEHRTGIAEVTSSNPVEVLIFLRLLPSNCLNWKIYCDDHSYIQLQPQYNMNFIYISQIISTLVIFTVMLFFLSSGKKISQAFPFTAAQVA